MYFGGRAIIFEFFSNFKTKAYNISDVDWFDSLTYNAIRTKLKNNSVSKFTIVV